MTLHDMQKALVKAGAHERTCEQCAEAMMLHHNCSSSNAQLTSMQAARMLWLVLICQDTAVVRTESLLLMDSKLMPRERGKSDSGTALQFLAAAIRSTNLATCIESVEVDAGTRLVTVEMRDDDPLEFATTEDSAYVSAPMGTMTLCGSLMCRLSMAYRSSVWLPITSDLIQHDYTQEEQGAPIGAAI